ncbi:MAG: FAD-dependent oxidoreductase, partial [Bacteroidetes bacterium]|nr:FAD-dependent oxidoreductase [Bacteroidota bacterium]
EAGVGIDYLKRFAADYDLNSPDKYSPETEPSTGKKVAVIGAGPGGLSVAWFLQLKGHQVEVFEASPKPGGMLRYGIPPYRLPNELIDQEVACITELGANIHYQKKLGEDLSYEQITKDFDATVLTIGSQKGTGVGCTGDDAGNVFSGIDFLRNIAMTSQKPDFSGKTVAVIGGGNTAMDCCRTAMRLGAKKTYVVYRRTEKEMPANPIEIHESKEEGIEYLFLNNPVEIHKNQEGNIESMTLIKMRLGEPDASGRRRPVPIENSEYQLNLDYVLAAIGQKTQTEFIDNINDFTVEGELKVNRWGDLDADKKTLQTGIPSVFAAGDGVTGPATLIEAIAQAKIASHSCHQYLSGQSIKTVKAEFLSKKDNFKKQDPADFVDSFGKQFRKEMPLIPPTERENFNEVELGYSEEQALSETARCLECGCSEYFSCDLKQLCDEYEADQTKYSGGFQSYEVRFDHPYIEIDSNKCILCSRCVRICQDVVGASALGLINRGFDTYVAPSMGESLKDGTCESCGLCISACPTGAITENVTFKPGPVKLESAKTICTYCSVGCTLEVNTHNEYVWSMTGAEGMINTDANLCRSGKFGYNFRNRKDRITKPLLKGKNGFEEISFKEAFSLIKEKVKQVQPDQNLIMAGARLSNEELYLSQKLAKTAIKTEGLSSFHYLGRSPGYEIASDNNVPFSELDYASRIYLFGSEIHEDNPVAGFMVNDAKNKNKIPITYISLLEQSKLHQKVDEICLLDSYYSFLKAVNYYLLDNGMENGLFIRDHVQGFEDYKTSLLQENYNNLVSLSGRSEIEIESFAKQYNQEQNAIVIFSDKDITSSEIIELRNLSVLTGKLGKTASGLICLREKNNSQGLIDMGIQKSTDPMANLQAGNIRNLFIFGEDPAGCALENKEVVKWLDSTSFIVAQDYFHSATTTMADLILPGSLPGEFRGSFTNTQKMIQVFEQNVKSPLEMSFAVQIIELLKEFGVNGLEDENDAHNEALQYVSKADEKTPITLNNSLEEQYSALFSHGCDLLTRLFNESFEKAFGVISNNE